MTSLVLPGRRTVVADLATVRPAIVYVALFGAVGAFFPYSSVLLAGRGLALEAVGLLLALHAVVSLAVAPLWGAVADRVGDVSRVLLAASVVAATGAVALAVAREPLWIAAALALLAAGSGGVVPLTDARAVELAGERRERFSRARAFGSAAFIVVSIATGALISDHSPDLLFVLFVPLLLATGLSAWRLLAADPAAPPTARRRAPRTLAGRRPGDGFLALLRLPGMLGLLVGSTLIWTAIGALMTFISIHITDQGGDLGTVGLTWAVGAAVEIPIMLLFPVLARRVGAERLMLLGAIAFAARAAGWALAGDPFVAVLVAPLGGVGFAFFYVGMVALIAASVPAEAQATAQGVFSAMAFSLGAVVGSALGGVAAPLIGLPGLFWLSAVGTLAAAAALARAVSIVRPGSIVRPRDRARWRTPRAA
jgi:PPP family 3-phenylpropionic acid transporter